MDIIKGRYAEAKAIRSAANREGKTGKRRMAGA